VIVIVVVVSILDFIATLSPPFHNFHHHPQTGDATSIAFQLDKLHFTPSERLSVSLSLSLSPTVSTCGSIVVILSLPNLFSMARQNI
jgi:hypothetical protein